MKMFEGTLQVETIRGRRGPFNVGKLITDIGEFKVKDKELDQFEPGDYSGNFQVERIYTASNPWRGGFFTEIIAKIADGGFLIDQEDTFDAQAGYAQVEPDPVDVEPKRTTPEGANPPVSHPVLQTKPVKPKSPTAATATDQAVKVQSQDEADLKLFGLEIHALFVAGAEIALDLSEDREKLRSQRDRLKQVGYRFQSQTQRWRK